MPEVPLRDRIALGMTEDIGKRYREKRKAAINQVETHHTYVFFVGLILSIPTLIQENADVRVSAFVRSADERVASGA
jgi:hypothetical protein